VISVLEINQVHQEDCIEGMKKLPKESVDLIIADPPYYKTINEEWDKQWKTEEEFIDWCRSWFKECVRVLKPTGSFYCYGFFDILSKLKVLVFDKELFFRQNITLNKGIKSIAGRTSAKLRMFPTASEYLLFYTKTDNDLVLLHQRDYLLSEWKKSKLKITQLKEMLGFTGNQPYNWFSPKNGGNATWQLPKEEHYRKLQETGFWQKPYEELKHEYDLNRFPFNLPLGVTDVWDFNIDKNRFHPTQKPKQITDRIIKASSNKNQIVLIPFGGSGAEVLSCIRNFRQFICFENNPQYFKIINDRIQSAKSQTKLPNGSFPTEDLI